MKTITDSTQDWATQRQLPVDFTAQTGSTNDNAKRSAMQESAAQVLYLTAHQTSGRGRGTNQWLDTGAGESLLSTWSLASAQPPQPISAPRVGLALFRAASRTWPSLSWGLKAPNDLYLDGLKAGGLLLETVSSGTRHRLLIGLGLNIMNHPRRLNTATHLIGALGHTPDEGEWFRFLDEWQQQLQAALADCQQTTLSPVVCQELKKALNANKARPFEVLNVLPAGDLDHAQGRVKWMDV